MTRIPHTPGPWDCEIYPNDHSYFQVFSDCSTIALVERWDKSDSEAAAEAQANARLIAAAPDLLSAIA